MFIWRRLGIIVPAVGIGLLVVWVSPSWGGGLADFYSVNRWAVWTTIGIASFALGLVGWLLNHRWRKPVVDPDTGAELGRPPSHSFFFIPVEYWSLLIPAVFVMGSWVDQESAKKELGFLQSPTIGDVYVMKLEELVDDANPGWVRLLKVITVSPESVEIVPSTVGFANAIDARVALEDGESGVPGFYATDPLVFTRDRLVDLWGSKEIERVLRTRQPAGP